MPRVSSRLFSSLFAAVGVLVALSALVPSAVAGGHLVVVWSLDAVALAAGGGLFLLGARVRPWLLHVAVQGGVLLITGALLASGGGTRALAYSALYLVPLYAFFVFTPRAATAHLAIAVLVGAPALAAQPGVGVDDQVLLWGVVLLQSVVIVWLVRNLAEAETDFTTGLINRRGLERSLELALTGREHTRPLSLVLLDLDHFKTLNDTRGRVAGDRLLAATAQAWADLVPPEAVLARWGGDVYALLVPSPLETAVALGDALREAVPAGTCSAGVAGWEPGDSLSVLVARTEAAVYVAKRSGRDRTHRHPGGGSSASLLREALDRGDFVVHFQPIVDLPSGRVVGAEALVRWEHPQAGLLPPAEFLPEAETSGMIVLLGEWVLREACRHAARWPVGADARPLSLSVNASGRELQDPSYGATVARALGDSGLDPHRLVIELVESDYDVTSLHLATNLHELRSLGVRLAIDDFGVGYSSLDRLRHLGVDVLKIDRSFVAEISAADQEEPLAMAMLAMARALRMRVVAEGVETAAQAEWLRRHGCESGQGYLFGRAGAGAPVGAAGRASADVES